MALDPFGLQHPMDPEAVETGLLDDDNREVTPGPRRSLRLSSVNRRSSPDTSPAGTECLDIFCPPPGDRDVISQALRDNSSETKIAPRSVRIAACVGRAASSGIVASRMSGAATSLSKSDGPPATPMGSIGAQPSSNECRP